MIFEIFPFSVAFTPATNSGTNWVKSISSPRDPPLAAEPGSSLNSFAFAAKFCGVSVFNISSAFFLATS